MLSPFQWQNVISLTVILMEAKCAFMDTETTLRVELAMADKVMVLPIFIKLH